MYRPAKAIHIGLTCLALVTACGDDAGGFDATADSSLDADTGSPLDADTGSPLDADTGSPRDSARPALESLTYTPDGCDFEVRTPELDQARRGGDVTGADPSPRFIHVSFAGPADTTFAVNWQTGVDTTVTQVLVGADADEVRAADAATGTVMRVDGHHVLFRDLLMDDYRIHEAHVCGLDPSSSYAYKVGGPGAWSEVFTIATAPPGGSTDAYRFAVTGDSRNDSVVWAETQRAVGTHAVDFQIFSGDAVQLGIDQAAWEDFFGQEIDTFAVQDVLATTPLMVANGNHEALALNYLLLFALPQDESPMETEAARGEEWYSFDYGNSHFAVLNDSVVDDVFLEAQRDWLRVDLGAVDRTTSPWIFVMHHRALYSCSTSHGSQLDIRALWQPVYDEFEVDMVFNGHDHIYERSRPIRGFEPGTTDPAYGMAGPDDAPVNQSGTVYVVSGGAGAPLYGSEACPHTSVNESTNHYAIVDVTDRSLVYTAFRLDGSTLDSVTITKP